MREREVKMIVPDSFELPDLHDAMAGLGRRCRRTRDQRRLLRHGRPAAGAMGAHPASPSWRGLDRQDPSAVQGHRPGSRGDRLRWWSGRTAGRDGERRSRVNRANRVPSEATRAVVDSQITSHSLNATVPVKVAGVWRYVYRAVDQYGQVIDVYVSKRRNVAAATRFFEMMLAGRERPTDVTTDLAAPLLRVVDDLLPEVLHDTTQYANNRIECDHGRLKARLRLTGLRRFFWWLVMR